MKFGDNLKKIRKNKKLSQEQLAEKMNVTRQSISKWENSESYPEMNNILKLCKIFNCQLNDLVHTDMNDISSLDKDVVMNVVKFNEKKQKEMMKLSNVIRMIGKVGSIVLKVAISFIVLVMILIPYVIGNIKVKDNEITFTTANIKIIDENKIKIHDVIVGEFGKGLTENRVIKILENNSDLKIIFYLELAMIFLLINVILVIIILNCVEKLFNNIKNNMTPFILENVFLIKKISYLMIVLIIIFPISGFIFNSILEIEVEETLVELMNILEILIIFSMSYIFEYGYELQKDANGKIYS